MPPYLGTILDDVWVSSDGTRWEQVLAHAPLGKRKYFDALVFDNKIWVFAGTSDQEAGVWSSPDGINWTEVLSMTPWKARVSSAALVYGGKMWIMGGFNYDSTLPLNDVWYSSDGINWTEATDNASWSARQGMASAVFAGKMWILGGRDEEVIPYGDLNDVWYSTDGANWIQATANASWRPRNFFKAVNLGKKLWIFGGGYQDRNIPRVNLNDVWSSLDGINWENAGDAPWSTRDSHEAVLVPRSF